jgi:hypothetical protein
MTDQTHAGIPTEYVTIDDKLYTILRSNSKILNYVLTPIEEQKYPCAHCGTMRTRAEGRTTFTVCKDCWEILSPANPAPRDEGGGVMGELKPCPFCGKSNPMWCESRDKEWSIVCNGCHIGTGHSPSRDVVVDCWNTRASESTPTDGGVSDEVSRMLTELVHRAEGKVLMYREDGRWWMTEFTYEQITVNLCRVYDLAVKLRTLLTSRQPQVRKTINEVYIRLLRDAGVDITAQEAALTAQPQTGSGVSDEAIQGFVMGKYGYVDSRAIEVARAVRDLMAGGK